MQLRCCHNPVLTEEANKVHTEEVSSPGPSESEVGTRIWIELAHLQRPGSGKAQTHAHGDVLRSGKNRSEAR